MLAPAVKVFAAEAARLVHLDRKKEAAQFVADGCQLKVKLGSDDDPKKYMPVLQNWLHYLLNNGGTVEAAQLLWTPTQFDPRPKFLQDLWALYDETPMGLIQGASSCGKSFGMGVRLFLEYVRDPLYTAIKLVGPSQDHLEANLFSAIVGLHSSASLPMPGEAGALFIGTSRRDQLGSIKGVTIPISQTKKAGRLQGMKRKPRPQAHPWFGPLSRLFVFIDEVENVPCGIWSDVDNILSQVDPDNGQGFKIFAAWNPRDLAHEIAKRAEPPFGWDDLDADVHFKWKSRRGWDVLRLDGEQSENVKEDKVIYPGLQTRAGLEVIAKNAGGTDSAGYSTMGRGVYPKQGATTAIIPAGMFSKFRGTYIWYDAPRAAASTDLALEGGSAAVLTLGKVGRATGIKFPPNLEHPQGRVVMFKNLQGQVAPRFGCQADQQFPLPKGDSVAMAERIMSICKKAGVVPRYYACDRTGAGAGTADLIKRQWGSDINDVNYSQSASDTKLMQESTHTCEQEYGLMCSELWFAMRALGEYGYFLISPEMDVSKLQPQVIDRLVKNSGKKSNVETKKNYKSRGFASPDEADSMTLFVHACRRGSGAVLSQIPESSTDDDDDGWYDQGGHYQGGARIDPSNRTDHLP